MIRRSLYLIYSPALLVGLLTGYWAEALLASAVFHLVWVYYYQKKLADWLWKDRSLVPPQGPGTWELIFNGIYRLQQRHRVRRRELAGVIRRFREGAEALPDAAVVCRNDGSIVWCNRLAGQLLGFRWPEDAGQNISNLIRTPAFVAYLKQADFSQPLEMVSPVNEERLLEFRIMPYTEDQTMIVVRDVTHLRSLDMMRKNFVANVSHELRTPLNSILGYAQILDGDESIPANRRQAVQVIRRSGDHLLSIIDSTIDVARIESGKLTLDIRPLAFPDFISQIVSMVELQARNKGLRFDYQPEGKLPMGVRADEKRLRQILLNLLGNAVKFTDHGSVSLKLSYRREMAVFEIHDTGPGIAADELARLFEPFERGRLARGGGSGLGLTISKMLTDLMGGELTVSSEPGQGSVFCARLYLPELRDASPGKPALLEQRIGYMGVRRRILIVDNEKIDRELLVSVLAPLGFELFQAESGAECLAALPHVQGGQRPRPDGGHRV